MLSHIHNLVSARTGHKVKVPRPKTGRAWDVECERVKPNCHHQHHKTDSGLSANKARKRTSRERGKSENEGDEAVGNYFGADAVKSFVSRKSSYARLPGIRAPFSMFCSTRAEYDDSRSLGLRTRESGEGIWMEGKERSPFHSSKLGFQGPCSDQEAATSTFPASKTHVPNSALLVMG